MIKSLADMPLVLSCGKQYHPSPRRLRELELEKQRQLLLATRKKERERLRRMKEADDRYWDGNEDRR